MRTILHATIAAAAVTLAATAAHAAGTPPAPSGTRTVERCADGRVWSEARERCVPAQSSQLTPRERLEAGMALAYAGRHAAAIEVLRLADADQPATQRMLGYAHRKAGRYEVAMTHYRAALALDPQDALTRSYMGAGLVAAGKDADARAELVRIARIAGRQSREYTLLAQALANGARGADY